jgi:hypothetical protein
LARLAFCLAVRFEFQSIRMTRPADGHDDSRIITIRDGASPAGQLRIEPLHLPDAKPNRRGL